MACTGDEALQFWKSRSTVSSAMSGSELLHVI